MNVKCTLHKTNIKHPGRFGILELPNRVTHNDVTLRVTNSGIFIETYIYFVWVTNSIVEIFLFHFRVTNSKSKSEKLHLEVKKYLISPQVTNSMVKLIVFRFRVTNSKLKNNKFHFDLPTRWVHIYFLTFELRMRTG